MTGIMGVYDRIGGFAMALPLVAALPVVIEFVQHVVEVSQGFYAGGGAAAAVATTPERMSVGVLKVLGILFAALVAARYWAFGGDARQAIKFDSVFFRGLAILVVVQIVLGGLLLGVMGAANSLAEIVPSARHSAMVTMLLVSLSTGVLLAPWYVGLLVGDRAMTLRRSVASMAARFPSSLALLLAAYLPGLLVHYALGYGAMGRPQGLVWGMLAADALVVGLLALLLGSAYAALYERAKASPARPAAS